jgi:hypothetical protein
MSLKRSLLLGFANALVMSGAASAAPAMSTIWQETSLDLPECVRHAELALYDAGMTYNSQTLKESVYGELGGYTASIRCLAGKGVVFIVVSGPRRDRASQLVGTIKGRF